MVSLIINKQATAVQASVIFCMLSQALLSGVRCGSFNRCASIDEEISRLAFTSILKEHGIQQ